MKKPVRLLATTALVLLTLSACGYRFSGEGAGPRPGLKYIAIPSFENRTSEPGLEAMFAGELRKEFMRKGPMVVVPEAEAEAVFRGRITDINLTSVAHRGFEQSSGFKTSVEDRLFITVEIRCVDSKTGKVLWQDPHFVYTKVFRKVIDPNAPDPLAGYENRRGALEYLAREMAARIHDRFLSDF